MFHRRNFLKMAAIGAFGARPAFAQQDYPSRPIRALIGFPAGCLYRARAIHAIESAGRAFPVETRYRGRSPNMLIERQVADTVALAEIILRSRPHPEQGFRSCIGILRLVTRYDAERLDAACARALALGTRSYSSVAAILKNRQDARPAAPQPGLFHENIRGPDYYH